MINIKRHKVADILDKMQFFQGSMAGRELWFDKPKEVQAQDCDNFTRDIRTIRDYILQIEEQANKKVDNWILCSERLPDGCSDAEIEVIVSTHESYSETVIDDSGFALYYPGTNKFHSVYGDRLDITEYVVAWQPLPTPYNKKRGGKNE